MFVQRVVVPSSRRESWTVIGDDGSPIDPVERYLAFLSDVHRSPNTVKAYAHDLKDWFVFLAFRGLDWQQVRLEQVGAFVAWLRLPPVGRDGHVAVLPAVRGPLRRLDGEPEAVGGQRVLSTSGAARCRPGRSAAHLAAGRSKGNGVAAVPAPHQQERAA